MTLKNIVGISWAEILKMENVTELDFWLYLKQIISKLKHLSVVNNILLIPEKKNSLSLMFHSEIQRKRLKTDWKKI